MLCRTNLESHPAPRKALEARAAILVHTGFTRLSHPGRSEPAPVGAWRRVAVKSFLKILEKRPARREIKSVGRTGLKGMIASGRQTASPRVPSEAVLATKSACQFSLEASPVSPIAFVISQIAPNVGAAWTQSTCLHPSVYTASRTPVLSVPVGERHLALS
jgi:hypothetical protein